MFQNVCSFIFIVRPSVYYYNRIVVNENGNYSIRWFFFTSIVLGR